MPPPSPTPRSRRIARAAVRGLLALAAACVLAYAGAVAAAGDAPGAAPEGARLARIEASPAWSTARGRFVNRLPRVDGPASDMLHAWFFQHSPHAAPTARLDVVRRARGDFDRPPATGLRATWLGHSTVLLEIDGARVLVDPVWGERTSPFAFAGPLRFYAPPIALEDLPPIDVVVISHDHYDHLDTPTVKRLARSRVRWAVPLGVGAHLERWGVRPEDVAELDWWEATEVAGLTVTATPARHFSGRWLGDADRTLWSGWAIAGADHRVFYSGDTAMFPGFVEIGERLGPFDLTMIEVGAYDALWADVHLGPEQAVRAHRLVRGEVLLPVHWGLFDLALHGWTEPIERVRIAAEREGVPILSPRPGASIEPEASSPDAVARWWPDAPWRTADEAPALSSHVADLWRDTAPAAAVARP